VKSIRLLPIVIMASVALLALKTIGLVSDGGYVLTGTRVAIAQTTAPQNESDGAEQFSDAAKKAADRATEGLFDRAAVVPIESSRLDAVPVSKNKNGEKIAFGTIGGNNETERAILERLGERRVELDLLSSEVDIRIALVEAAEKRLAERIAGLEEIETRIDQKIKEKKALDDEQFKGLVAMYETMKPSDAASIFNDLPMNVLLRVASNMSSRKMAPVLAKMNIVRATELTQALAAIEAEPKMDQPLDDLENLPQIVGQ